MAILGAFPLLRVVLDYVRELAGCARGGCRWSGACEGRDGPVGTARSSVPPRRSQRADHSCDSAFASARRPLDVIIPPRWVRETSDHFTGIEHGCFLGFQKAFL